MVPKEFKYPRRTVQDVAIGLQDRCYIQIWKTEVFHPTKVAYRVFLPVNYKFFPCNGVVCVGYIGSVLDIKQ